jgi:hypothetical protein
MADPTSLGTDDSGVPQGQMRQDLMALSDPAKKAAAVAATRQAALQAQTQQNLQAAQSGGDIQSLGDKIADHVLAQTTPDPEAHPHQYIQYVTDRIGNLEKELALAKKSKNVKAVQAYEQVIDILHQRAMGIQNKLAARMTAAPAATSQPAPAAPAAPEAPTFPSGGPVPLRPF